MADQKVVICPYCGGTQPLAQRCKACSGLFEPLSRQATHNAMGPWFVRDAERPFQPGCSYDTMRRLIERGRVSKLTIVRGPTTRQFWTIAKHVPGLSHLLGYCYQCDASVDAGDHACHACGATFGSIVDRNFLGLPEVRPMPWEADAQDDLRSMHRDEPGLWRSSGEQDGPRTISCFASDAELLGHVESDLDRDATRERGSTQPSDDDTLPQAFGPDTQPHTVATLPEASAQAQPQGAPAAQPAAARDPAPQPSTASLVDQSLRRRITQQQRSMKRLGIMAGVCAVAAIIFALGWFDAASGTVSEPVANDRIAVPTPAPVVTPDEPEEPAQTPEPEPEEPVLAVDVRADYDRATGLLEAADDEQRTLTERIEDYVRAVRLLEGIVNHAEQAHWPDDVQERLAYGRAQRDRLRMEEFFP